MLKSIGRDQYVVKALGQILGKTALTLTFAGSLLAMSTLGSIAWAPPDSSASHTTTSQVLAPNVSQEMLVSRLYLFAQQHSRAVQIEAQSNTIASSDLARIPSIWCIPPLDTRYC
jgi:hypothetical protein